MNSSIATSAKNIVRIKIDKKEKASTFSEIISLSHRGFIKIGAT